MTTKADDERTGDSEHVRVRFELPRDEDGSRPAASETLWAIPTGVAGHFRIDNIPFFVVGVSVGDVVLAEPGERTLEFVTVVEKSGHRSVCLSYRSDQIRSAVRTRLTELGCRVERGDMPKVLAVDVPPRVSLVDVTAYLAGMEETGELSYYENDVGSRSTPLRRWSRPSTPPFSERPDLGVFVSRRAVAGDLVRVVDHDEDGDWVFLTGAELRDESGSIACGRTGIDVSPGRRGCPSRSSHLRRPPAGALGGYVESEHRWLWSALEPEE